MGFCLFNNVAVAADYLLNERVGVETFVLFFVEFLSNGDTAICHSLQGSKRYTLF
jgi:hypothetical protein